MHSSSPPCTVSELAYANPFVPRRVDLERAVLGAEFVEGEPVWSMGVDRPDQPRANVWKIIAVLEPLVEGLREQGLRERFAAGSSASGADLPLYEDTALHLMYRHVFPHLVEAAFGASRPKRWQWRTTASRRR